MIFTYQEIKQLPTLSVGHFANLKIDDTIYRNGVFIKRRIWLSKCSIQDGELDPIQVEIEKDGIWIDVTHNNNYYFVQGQGLRAGIRTTDGKWFKRDKYTGEYYFE